jgi:hypothetical protein
MWAPGEIVCI